MSPVRFPGSVPGLQPSRGAAGDVDRRDAGGGVDPRDCRCARRAAHEHGRAVSRGPHHERPRDRGEAIDADRVAIRAGRARLPDRRVRSMATATACGPARSLPVSIRKSARRNSSAACFRASGSASTMACRMSTARFRPAATVSGSAPAGYSRLGPTAQRPPAHSTSGGDEDMYAVRILGITGRTRVLRFHPGTGQWITP